MTHHTDSYQSDAILHSLQRGYREIDLLQRVSTGMRHGDPPDEIWKRICSELQLSLKAQDVFILLRVQEDPLVAVHHFHGQDGIELTRHQRTLLWQAMLDSGCQTIQYEHGDDLISSRAFSGPLLLVPLKQRGELGGVIAALGSAARERFSAADARMMTTLAARAAVYLENLQLSHGLQELMLGALRAITRTLEAKDPITRGHSDRVAALSYWLGREIGLGAGELQQAYLAGLLHDIGKIGVPESILSKPGPLTAEEFRQVQCHPKLGATILRDIRHLEQVNQAVLTHHERYDGTGYPAGLCGEEIPLLGRIVGLADSFDAMTSRRDYCEALSPDAALEEIRRSSGTQFDPELCEHLLRMGSHELMRELDELRQYQPVLQFSPAFG